MENISEIKKIAKNIAELEETYDQAIGLKLEEQWQMKMFKDSYEQRRAELLETSWKK